MKLIDARYSALHFAARPRVVAFYLGQMLLAVAALALVPALAAGADGQWGVAGRHALVIAALGIGGGLGARLRVQEDLQRNEALAVAALTFVLPSLLFAVPLAGYGLSWDAALFESVSGLTTTGLTMLTEPGAAPASLLFLRAWLQWIGGLGVLVLVLALLVHPGAAARHLGFSRFEASAVAGGTRAHARLAAKIYLGLSAAGFLLLWPLEGDAFDALLHTLAAVSTGGYSSHADSLAPFGAPARGVVMALCLAGAVAFYSYYAPAISSWRALAADTQLRALLLACALVSALLYVLLPEASAYDALLLGVSAQTTAGFTPLEIAGAQPGAQLVLILAMLVGGAMGSTAGGIKVLRALVLVRLAQLLMARAMLPRGARLELRVSGAPLERAELETVVGVVACYGAVLLVSWLVFLGFGQAPLAALFEVSSALATCGLSMGLAGPQLEPALKLVLCADMLLGRVETVALIVLLLPGTWIGRRRRST